LFLFDYTGYSSDGYLIQKSASPNARNKEIPRSAWLWLALSILSCNLLDWALTANLPRLGLSFGPVWSAVGILAIFRLVILLVMAFCLVLTHSARKKLAIVIVTGLIQASLVVFVYDAFYIEPFRLTVTDLPVRAPAFLPDRPLRILQISDLHVEQITQRERDVLARAASLQPDIIVLTGDYVNASYANNPLTLLETRQLLSRLFAPDGIYAIDGNVDDLAVMSTLFTGLANIRVLSDEVLPIRLPGGTLYLVGMTTNTSRDRVRRLQALMAGLPSDAYSILLYHYPSLIQFAASARVDLYLAGHTHGGQIRLPIFGPIYMDRTYRNTEKYNMGEYALGPTTLYVSRGLGMAGGLLPRARFLCPPELVLLELGK
jgi:uncharacterized protein